MSCRHDAAGLRWHRRVLQAERRTAGWLSGRILLFLVALLALVAIGMGRDRGTRPGHRPTGVETARRRSATFGAYLFGGNGLFVSDLLLKVVGI